MTKKVVFTMLAALAVAISILALASTVKQSGCYHKGTMVTENGATRLQTVEVCPE